MRKIFVLGLTTLAFALGSIDADAAVDKHQTRHAAMHRRAVGAASIAQAPRPLAIDETFSAHYSGEDQHDPAFSHQPNEIDRGRLGHDQDHIARLMKPDSTQRIRNPNECAPDRAEPSWGPGASLLGYKCYSENGN
jgi:hypothetical protein